MHKCKNTRRSCQRYYLIKMLKKFKLNTLALLEAVS